MKLLDLFCGAGGCTKGYQMAGFEVTGVDINPQPRYCGDAFALEDAIEYVMQHGHEFDVIHASPPCQSHTLLKNLRVYDPHYLDKHPDLIDETREALTITRKPYVIENVPGAPLIDPILLCGAMFGLKVYRHRLFESNLPLPEMDHIPHLDSTPRSGRGMSPKGFICITGTGGLGVPDGTNYARFAMGIEWMNRSELSQAIPPAYTLWIGNHLMTLLQS